MRPSPSYDARVSAARPSAASAPAPRYLVAGAILGALAISRFLAVLDLRSLGWFLKYVELAKRAADGAVPFDRLTDVSPLYLWFFVAITDVGGTPGFVIVMQALAMIVVAGLCGMIAWRAGGEVPAFLATAFVLMNEGLFVNASDLEPEALIVFLNFAALALFIRERPSSWHLAGAGVLLGLSAAARPSALAVVAALTLYAVLRREIGWRRALGFLTAAMIPIAGFIALNAGLTGHATLMNPGTVFYEGMNPQATGYASGEPLVVSDLVARLDSVDAVHVAYRIVSSAATGGAFVANEYWTGKAIAYVRERPLEALALAGRKAFFLIHSYDAWDVSTMVRKDWAADRWIWIPFGGLVVLALPLAYRTPRKHVVVPLALYALASSVAPLAFYVTARQRNPLVPAVAILAAIGCLHLAALVRTLAPLHRVLAAVVAITLAGALILPGHWQDETDYQWLSVFASEELLARAAAAGVSGEEGEALRAREATWLSGEDIAVPATASAAVRGAALEVVRQEEAAERRFDAALALMRAGDLRSAGEVLAALESEGYVPRRRAQAVATLAFYRAVAAAQTGSSDATGYAERALTEQPADPSVLALAATLLGDDRASARLDRLHDPYTAAIARVRVLVLLGHRAEAHAIVKSLIETLPQWHRPRQIDAALEPGVI